MKIRPRIFLKNYKEPKGIATKVLELLIKESKNRGVTDISLEATEMGRLLYEKSGFVKMNNEMNLSN